jgi:protein N-terminal methyltransferase
MWKDERMRRYWANAPPTIDGVLGGMGHVHEIDIRDSRAFLESLELPGRDRAIDCAAGIGRVSKHLLCPMFKLTDVMEPMEHMLNAAKAELPASAVGEFLCCSMGDAVFRHSYDLVAIQWAAAYLADDDLVSFLSRCKAALKPGGLIFLKDNVSSRNNRSPDEDDRSVARSNGQYKAIFAAANVTCIKEQRQRQWPSDLYEARMYALR